MLNTHFADTSDSHRNDEDDGNANRESVPEEIKRILEALPQRMHNGALCCLRCLASAGGVKFCPKTGSIECNGTCIGGSNIADVLYFIFRQPSPGEYRSQPHIPTLEFLPGLRDVLCKLASTHMPTYIIPRKDIRYFILQQRRKLPY